MIKTMGFLCLLSIFISGCCSKDTSKEEKIQINKSPASIQENRSLVEAEVIEIIELSDNNYTIEAKILNIEEDGAYPNMAVVGESYQLAPGYVVDDKGKIDYSSERNKDLKEISGLKKGDKIKAEIYFNDNKKWIIRSLRN